MTDPIYGDHPLDPGEMWDATFPPPLVLDPEWVALRSVWVSAIADVLESQWLTRWRGSVSTAEGIQLDTRGAEIVYPRPDGWTDARYQAVVSAMTPASFARQTSTVAYNLATALLDGAQTMTFTEQYPCSATFTFLETDADDATAYNYALDRARPRGCQFQLVAHPGGGLDPFTIGTSEIGGPDTLAALFGP